MDELELYCASDNRQSKYVMLVGNCGIERIEEFFSYTNLRECILLFSWTEEDIQILEYNLRNHAALGRVTLPEKLICMSVSDFHGLDGEWTLLSMGCKSEDLIPFTDYHPYAIAGTIYAGRISAFNLWERVRELCSHFYLKTTRENQIPLVLQWDKGVYAKELSVILPVYNVEAYIEKCLDTITCWKADYVEFIFVSDGSKDSSADIIRRYAEHDSRIVLIEKENGGCASARQAGLERASGKYVGFVDPDDFIEINMFHKLLKTAMEGDFDISLCGYKEFYENTGRTKNADDFIVQPYIDGCYDSDKLRELIAYSRVAIWRGIYKREFLEKNNIHFYTDIRRFDDLPFKVETFAFAKSVVMVPENLYYYRLQREGQDVAADDERLYVHFDIFKHLDKSIGASRNQEIIDYYQMCKIQTHRYALEKIRSEYKAEYTRRMLDDLQSLMDKNRTYKMARIYLGEEISNEMMSYMNGK